MSKAEYPQVQTMRLRHTLRSVLRTRSKFLVTVFVLSLIYTFMTRNVSDVKKIKETKITKYSNRLSTKTLKYLLVPVNQNRSKNLHLKSGKYFIPPNLKKKDWHNYTLIEQENRRVGLGEQGKQGNRELSAKNDTQMTFMLKHRMNTVLSDTMALNRSLPDARHIGCKKKLYLESLPSVSVIVVFHNEYLSTLLRTVYSVLNRSPEELIKEIFLVDDASTEDIVKEKLDNYVNENLHKVKVVRLSSRSGVVGARLAGAKLATADVLVFLDSHVEVNVNWLPPLLEPIALNYRTAVEPLVDRIDVKLFEYRKEDEGARGIFDWSMTYVRNMITQEDFKNLPEPFKTPMMMGMVAISRHFFWELGGYDTGLEIWGGEQVELSLKIWMCGGQLLQAPCSRIGHLQRKSKGAPKDYHDGDFVFKNFRRIVEVWCDEHARFLFEKNPNLRKVDPGDLTEQKAIRKRLKCKPFKWFLTQVAFDLLNENALDNAPLLEGWVRPEGKENLCVDAAQGSAHDRVVLNSCVEHPDQIWQYTFLQEIRTPSHALRIYQEFNFKNIVGRMKLKSRNLCLDVPEHLNRGAVLIICCHRMGGNQKWQYNEKSKSMEHSSGYCLDYDPTSLIIFVTYCDKKSQTQRWIFNKDVVFEKFEWELENEPEIGVTSNTTN